MKNKWIKLIFRKVFLNYRDFCELAITPRMWLKGFDMITYIIKGVLFFLESPLLRTPQLSILAVGAILGWVTSWKVSQIACERGQNTPKRFLVIYRPSQRSLKLFLVNICGPGGVGALNSLRFDLWKECYCMKFI